MNPLTVLLWLLCAFVVAVFFGVIGLFVYMIKERNKSAKEFHKQRAAMGMTAFSASCGKKEKMHQDGAHKGSFLEG